MRRILTALVLASALFLQSCHREHGITIAVIPKGTTHVYWKSVQAGAEKAAAELGVKMVWKGPMLENDRDQQSTIVTQFVGDNVSAIVLAPLDDQALLKPVREAHSANIPVVIIDSALEGEPGKDFVSFIATDNHHGGVMAGEKLVELLHGHGKVVMLRYQEGSASTTEREAGFMEVMDKHAPGIQVIVKDRFGGATSSEAQTEAGRLHDKLEEADGIFCPNESSTFGMLLALKDFKLAGKKKFVGFDASQQLIEGVQHGEIDALVVQDPFKMGYEGVKAAVAAVRKQPFEAHIDTGAKLITKADLTPETIEKLVGH